MKKGMLPEVIGKILTNKINLHQKTEEERKEEKIEGARKRLGRKKGKKSSKLTCSTL